MQLPRAQAPRPAANEGAHGELPLKVALQGVVTQGHIHQAALPVWHGHLHQARTIVAHRHLQPTRTAQGEQVGALAVQLLLKRFA